MKKNETLEMVLGGIFGAIAIIAAILSIALGEVNASTVFGCIKDVASTIVAVLVLLVAIRQFRPKKAGDFKAAFNKEMDMIIEKYSPLISADNGDKNDKNKETTEETQTPKKERDFIRYNIAKKLDAMFSTENPGTPIRFFDFSHNKSTITLFVQGHNFGDRVEDVSKDLVKTLKERFGDVADISSKIKPQVSVSVEFKEPLINEDDARLVTQVIDHVIFCYIAEYKK